MLLPIMLCCHVVDAGSVTDAAVACWFECLQMPSEKAQDYCTRKAVYVQKQQQGVQKVCCAFSSRADPRHDVVRLCCTATGVCCLSVVVR